MGSTPPQIHTARDPFAATRALARDIFLHGLQASSIERPFERHVDCDGGVLRVCDDLYDLANYSSVLVVSFGKAAHSMATALVKVAGVGGGGVFLVFCRSPH